MNMIKIEIGTGGWATISMLGTLSENQSNVMDALDKGKGDTAKVIEGSDSNGNKLTFVIIQDYKP